MVQKLKKSKGETENGRKKFANRMAEETTPFANFSLFLRNLYLQGLEGDFMYTEKFAICQPVEHVIFSNSR